MLRSVSAGSFSPTSTERTLVYSGTQVSHVDDDTALRPYTRYEYMVTAVNSQGKADSEWRRIRTKEAPPENVPPPTITVYFILQRANYDECHHVCVAATFVITKIVVLLTNIESTILIVRLKV